MSLRLSLSAAVMLGSLGVLPLVAPAQAGTLPSRENSAGMVMITATPLDVSPSQDTTPCTYPYGVSDRAHRMPCRPACALNMERER